MAKVDTVNKIKELLGIQVDIDPEQFTQKELDALLEAAQKGAGFFESAVSDLLQARKESSKNEQPEEGDVADENKIKVVTGDKAVGSFMHPVSKQTIRLGKAEPVLVPDDAWTQEMIDRRFLKAVRK